VIVAGPVTHANDHSLSVRIRNVTATDFEIALTSPCDSADADPNAAGNPCPPPSPGNSPPWNTETVRWLAVPPGQWTFPDGTKIEAATVSSVSTVRSGVGSANAGVGVAFQHSYGSRPIVLHTVNTTNDDAWITSSVFGPGNNTGSPPDTSGFTVALEGAEVTASHGSEDIGWVAIEPGDGSNDGNPYSAGVSAGLDTDRHNDGCFAQGSFTGFGATPDVVAGHNTMQGTNGGWLRLCGAGITTSNVNFHVDEDQVNDGERTGIPEASSWFAFAADGIGQLVKPVPPPLVDYRMDEPGWNGTLDEVGDNSGNGHAGTAVGGATTDDTEPARAGDPGTCGYGTFDGVDDGVDDGDAGAYLNGLSAVTVSAWVYNTAGLGGNDRGIFFTGDTSSGKDHRLGIRYDTSGFNGGGNNVIKAGIQTTDCNDGDDCVQVETEPNVMIQNGWQHVAMTWVSGGDLRVYVNGQDVTGDGTGDLGQGTGGTIDAVNALNIGQGAKGERWQGRIDEFRVWDQELDAAEIQAVFQDTHPCPVLGVDHYAIGHDGTAVTCGAEAITIVGHDGGDNPVDPGNVTIDLATSTGEGTWASVLTGSGTLADATAGDGAGSYTFPGNGETSVTLAFNYTTVTEATDPETVNFDVNGGNEGAGEDPDLVVSRTGFRITDGSGNAVNVPEQIAGKPSDEAPGAVSLALQAVRASDNDPSVCEPFFPDGGDVEVELGGECNDPDRCDGTSLEVTNNGNTTAVATSDDNGGAGTAAYTPVTLRFGPDAEAPLVLAYDDAGRIQLHARYNAIDDGSGTPPVVQYVVGASNQYVTRPFGFEVDVPADDGTTGAGGNILAVAGDDFDSTVRAVTWQAGDDSDDDGRPDTGADLSGNATTTNFGNEATPEAVILTPVVAAPAGGSDGTLTGALFDAFGAGSETHGVSWSEVGHVHLDANLTDGSYLGGSDATGRADTVGRFIPADFLVTVADNGDLAAGCNALFTYTGQASGYAMNMEPQLLITARNRGAGTTTNYRGAYAKLVAGDVSVAAPTEDASQVGDDGVNNVGVSATINTGTRVINGDGTVTYTFDGGDAFTYDRNANARIDGFTPDIDLDVTAVDDGEASAATPLPTAEPVATHEIRFGRLAIDSASGSELAPIGQPVRAEIWNNGTWQTHADDDCTSLVLASEVQLDNGSTTVAGDQSIAVGGGTTDLVSNTPDPVDLAGGQAVLTFAAPGGGNTGFVDTTLTLGSNLPWLQGDWDDSDGAADGPFDDDPTARVTFGIFSGNPNWIHFRRAQ
jgi:MSHA biogenesis protein MshQ